MKNTSVKTFVDGVTTPVIDALVGAVIVIASRSIIDIPTVIITIISLCMLICFNKVKEPFIILLAAIAGLFIHGTALAQANNKILTLTATIDMPGVSGRIDHFAFDPVTQTLYMAALGNHSVEVIDLKRNKVIHSISGLHEPQGIAYIKENHTILVANGDNGRCDIFDTRSFAKIKDIPLAGDADNVRYDSNTKKIYVGYGNGGIAVIDAFSFKQEADIKLEGHPESFQLSLQDKKMFVNVPDKQQVVVVDLASNTTIGKWNLAGANSNFPMALDDRHHRLFIGCRHPAKILVLDSHSGKLITTADIAGDTDDLFYNTASADIYATCGAGYINLIHQVNADRYMIADKTSSRPGARTSLLIPALNRLVVAAPKNIFHNATLYIYQIKN